MNKEFSLTITRLSSLLLIFKDSTNYLLDDYELDKLEYTLNANFYKKCPIDQNQSIAKVLSLKMSIRPKFSTAPALD